MSPSSRQSTARQPNATAGGAVASTARFFQKLVRPVVRHYTNKYAVVSAFPWRVRNLANMITVMRLVLSMAAAYGLYLFPAYAVRIPLAVCLFLLAASDGIDGSIARGLGIQSRFGAAVDPLADFAMVGSLAYFLVRHLSSEGASRSDISGLWTVLGVMVALQILVFTIGILRDDAMKAQGLKATSTKSGKIKFVVQCLAVAAGWLVAPTHFATQLTLVLLLIATVATLAALASYVSDYLGYRRP